MTALGLYIAGVALAVLSVWAAVRGPKGYRMNDSHLPPHARLRRRRGLRKGRAWRHR